MKIFDLILFSIDFLIDKRRIRNYNIRRYKYARPFIFGFRSVEIRRFIARRLSGDRLPHSLQRHRRDLDNNSISYLSNA